MDQTVLERMVRDQKITSAEILAQTPIDGLDAALTVLMRHRSTKEVCHALMERIAQLPVAELGALKGIYFRSG